MLTQSSRHGVARASIDEGTRRTLAFIQSNSPLEHTRQPDHRFIDKEKPICSCATRCDVGQERISGQRGSQAGAHAGHRYHRQSVHGERQSVDPTPRRTHLRSALGCNHRYLFISIVRTLQLTHPSTQDHPATEINPQVCRDVQTLSARRNIISRLACTGHSAHQAITQRKLITVK